MARRQHDQLDKREHPFLFALREPRPQVRYHHLTSTQSSDHDTTQSPSLTELRQARTLSTCRPLETSPSSPLPSQMRGLSHPTQVSRVR